MSAEENKALIRKMGEDIWIKHDLDAGLGLMQQLGIVTSEDVGVEWAAGEDEDAG